MKTKLEGRARRKSRIRKKVNGTGDRPRLTVFRSARHIYAQVVDDRKGHTVVAISSVALSENSTKETKINTAKTVGAAIAKTCKEKGIDKVVFDRNGYLYHGRVRALADGAREAGLEF